MKVVLYIRVSTDKQEADNQTLQLRNYCVKMGYDIVKEYVDVISGKENSRPAFDRMFRDSKTRSFDMVIFWDLSRFSRSGTLFTLQKLKELDNIGVGWHSYQDAYLSSLGDFKDVVLSILSTLAKIEREKISERTKAGLERAILRGSKLGRPKGARDKKRRKTEGYRGLKKGVATKEYQKAHKMRLEGLKSSPILTSNSLKEE